MYGNYLAHYGVKGMKWGQRKRHTVAGSFVRLSMKNTGAGLRYAGRNLRHPIKQGLSGKSKVLAYNEFARNSENFAKDITKNRKNRSGVRRLLARQALGNANTTRKSAKAYESFRKDYDVSKALNSKVTITGEKVLNMYLYGYSNVSNKELRDSLYKS